MLGHQVVVLFRRWRERTHALQARFGVQESEVTVATRRDETDFETRRRSWSGRRVVLEVLVQEIKDAFSFL